MQTQERAADIFYSWLRSGFPRSSPWTLRTATVRLLGRLRHGGEAGRGRRPFLEGPWSFWSGCRFRFPVARAADCADIRKVTWYRASKGHFSDGKTKENLSKQPSVHTATALGSVTWKCLRGVRKSLAGRLRGFAWVISRG